MSSDDVPLVSVISPTWNRHDLLLNRCIPSVEQQTYPRVEHIIVSDGPDAELAEKLFPPLRSEQYTRWFYALAEHDPAPHWGHFARLHALEYASGDIITYCDDDNSLRPEHCELLVNALLKNPGAGWARSLMALHRPEGTVMEIGHGGLFRGNIDTQMIAHRREMTEHGTWGPASAYEDWELINRWLNAEIEFVFVNELTVDVYPASLFEVGGSQGQ